MNVLIHGIGGKMGRILYSCLQKDNDTTVVAGADKFADPNDFQVPLYKELSEVKESFDIIIDYSVHSAIGCILDFAKRNNKPIVIATTGFTESELSSISEAAKVIPIFRSGNMSLGVNVISKLAKIAAEMLGDKADFEIVEQHHNLKTDAPSGTALLLANSIKEALPEKHFTYGRSGDVGKRNKDEIGIHAVRGGTIVGKHEIFIILDNEVITIKHESESRTIFALGSIQAAKYLLTKTSGLYDMNNMLS